MVLGGSISLIPLISTGLMDYRGYLMYIYDKYPDIHDFSCFFMFFRNFVCFWGLLSTSGCLWVLLGDAKTD